jgi:chromosome segregation ATPase
MKDVNSQISSISASLDRSRNLLDVYEKRARTDIGREVSQMRNALLQSSERIGYVSSEIAPFMKRIENHTGDRGDEPDLTRQLIWMRENLTAVLTDIEMAEAKAIEAMSLTMSYQSSVSDVRQTAETGQRQLREAQGTAVAMKSMAETRLEQSNELVDEARSAARAMKLRKDALEGIAAEIRSELADARERVREMNRLLAEARAEAEKAKDGAIMGGVS